MNGYKELVNCMMSLMPRKDFEAVRHAAQLDAEGTLKGQLQETPAMLEELNDAYTRLVKKVGQDKAIALCDAMFEAQITGGQFLDEVQFEKIAVALSL